MMEALRRGSSGWLAKGLLSILILSFVVFFGAGDSIRRTQSQEVATVGTTVITQDQFNVAFRNEINSASQELRRQLPVEDARKLGLDRRALSRLAGEVVLDNQARDLGVAISEQSIVQEIMSEPSFKRPDGSFDRRAFEETLRQRNLTEQGFLRRVKAEEARNIQTSTLAAGLKAPRAYVDIIHNYIEELRTVESVTFEPEKMIKLPVPDADKIKAFYEASKASYMTPELRKATVLVIGRDAVAKSIQISDAEIAQRYEQEKASVHTLIERRRVQQFPMPDEAKAKAAVDAITKAKTFDDALKALNFKLADVDLGLVVKSDMLDATVRDAAFGMALNETRVVKGQFGTFVIRVPEIQAARTKPLAEVASAIRDTLAADRVNREIETLHAKVDDLRAGGQPLKDIGAQLKIYVQTFDELDRSAKAADGKPLIDHPDSERIILQAFLAQPDQFGEGFELKDRGFAWVDVHSVTAPKQKAFEAVEGDVKTAFAATEMRREVVALTGKFVERMRKGELTLEAFAREVGSTIERTAVPLKRSVAPENLGRNAVQQAFAVGRGDFAVAPAPKGSGRIVLRVVDIQKAPAPTAAQLERLDSELSAALTTDVLNTYVSALEAKYPITVNNEGLRNASGQTTDN